MSSARSRTLTEKQHLAAPKAGPSWPAALAASFAAIIWSWRHGAMLNYGDAVAHLHIARRVFDSRTPRFSQLGSVWLPLPHILLIPFVQNYAWWANGLAGVIPSALAYIAACAGIYRLARHWLRPAAAALALAFFALNPNLLYLQTTAMTEPLFLCEMIWIVVWLVEWRAESRSDRGVDRRAHPRRADRPARLHRRCRCCIAAIFTRYDGWIIAFLAWTGIGLALLQPRPSAFACLLAGQRRRGRRAHCSGSFTTPLPSATGSTSRADLTPPRPLRCAPLLPAHGRRIPAGTIPGSRCSFISKCRSLTPSPRTGATLWAMSFSRSPRLAPSRMVR